MSITFLGDNPADILNNLERPHADISQIKAGAAPTQDDLETAPIIDHWQYGARLHTCAFGVFFGHLSLGDRRLVRTSELIAIDTVSGWARTWSRFYRFGRPADLAPSSSNA